MVYLPENGFNKKEVGNLFKLGQINVSFYRPSRNGGSSMVALYKQRFYSVMGSNPRLPEKY